MASRAHQRLYLRASWAVLWLCALCAQLVVLSGMALAQEEGTETRPPPQEAIDAYARAREDYKQGRYPAAIEQLERAISLDPESPDLVYNVARVYELMGELGNAVHYYEQYKLMLPASDTEERQRVRETIARLRGAQQYVERAEGHGEPAPPAAPPMVRHGVADGAFWTLAALSLGSLAAGGVTGGLALSRRAELDGFVLGEDGDLADRERTADQVDRLALSADVLLGTGAVTAVTALLVYALRTRPVQDSAEASRGRLRFVPSLGVGQAGVIIGGCF